MPDPSQLEIIHPNGDIEFHTLDPLKGITNIGRHPDNDLVIESAAVAPFQAMLDHRQRPHHLLSLSSEGQMLVQGKRLESGTSAPLSNWDTIELDGYSLILLESSDVPAQEQVAQAVKSLEEMALSDFFYDQTDDLVITEVGQREWTVNVEEQVACPILLVNGGDIVAAFTVRVEGLDPGWVTISPPQVNLYEGGRATINIFITAPRAPSSREGPHRFAIVVTSPNYPGHVSRVSATLILNPYYDFTVSELARRQQTVSWSRRYGLNEFSILNRGNSRAQFTIEGSDDERACLFEFGVPGQEAMQSGQVGLRLLPDESVTVPIRISPLNRYTFGVRSRTYPFKVTTNVLATEQSARIIVGQLKSKPLMGPLHVILGGLLLLILAIIITRPNITEFYAQDGSTVLAGDPVTLVWRGSPFVTNWKIDEIEEEFGGQVRQTSVVPQVPGQTFVLHGNNLFSSILGRFGLRLEATKTVRVLVLPLPPLIGSLSGLEADKKYINFGDSVTVKWSVGTNVQDLKLYIGNSVEQIPPEEFIGQREIKPQEDTLVVLEARNASGTDIRSAMIMVYTPQLIEFNAQPTQITAGEYVTITWAVDYVDKVSIAPLTDPFPPFGSMVQQPEKNTQYVLSYKIGESQVHEMREVIVLPAPTPTPLPEAPVIEFFTASPDQVLSGQANQVELAWSVKGKTTNIQITSLKSYNASNLKPADLINIQVREPALLILTAFNGDLMASQTVAIKGIDVKPTEVPPGPEIVFFKAEGDKDFEDQVVFQNKVQQADGPVYTYMVLWGAKVVLSWETKNADVISLNDESQPPAGKVPKVITGPVVLVLKAQNAVGKVQATIAINMDWSSLPNKVYLPMVYRSYVAPHSR